MTMTELERRCVDAAGRIYDARISDPATVGYRLDLVRAVLAEAGVAELLAAGERLAKVSDGGLVTFEEVATAVLEMRALIAALELPAMED